MSTRLAPGSRHSASYRLARSQRADGNMNSGTITLRVVIAQARPAQPAGARPSSTARLPLSVGPAPYDQDVTDHEKCPKCGRSRTAKTAAGVAGVCMCLTLMTGPVAPFHGYRPHMTGGAAETVTIGDFLHDEPGGGRFESPFAPTIITGGTISPFR